MARALLDADGFAFDGNVWAASGADFPDALAGGPAVHRDRGLLLVPPRGALPASVAEVAGATGGTGVVVLGGTAAVADTTARALADAVA